MPKMSKGILGRVCRRGYVYVDHGYFTNFYGGGSGLFMS